MTSTSSESVVLRGDLGGTATPTTNVTELRAGTWTRLGASTVLGDSATEATLGALADRTRAAGMAQGYAAGWAEGRRRAQDEADHAAAARTAADLEATQELQARHQALVVAVDGIIESCNAQLALRAEQIGAEATELGLRIAEAILGRELAVMTDPGAEAIARAVAEVPATAAATVRLHPEDKAALDVTSFEGRPLTVMADAGVPRGGALLETDITAVDATLATALDQVRAVLTAPRGA